MSEQRGCWYRDICEKHYPGTHLETCTHEKSWECPIADKIQDMIMDGRDAQRDAEREEE